MPAARAPVPLSLLRLDPLASLRILLAALIAFAPLSECWAGLDATGRWSQAKDLGNQGIHLALLRGDTDGDPHSYILFWQIMNATTGTLRGGLLAWNPMNPEGSPCDPSTDTHNVTSVDFANQPPMDLFCGAHSALADGRLLVAGGHVVDNVGPREATIFNAATQAWSDSFLMDDGRWYASGVALSDTRMAIFGGSSHYNFLTYGGRRDGTTARDPKLQRLYVDDQQAWQPLLTITPDPVKGQPKTRHGHTLIGNGEDPPILFGGRDSTGDPSREMWYLRDTGGGLGGSFKWDLRAPRNQHLVPRLSGHSAVMDTFMNGNMWVFGGLDSTGVVINDVYQWDAKPPSPFLYGQWFWDLDLSGGPPSARQHHTAIYDGVGGRNRMLVFGGLDASGNAISDNSIWELNLSTLTWTQPDVTGGPPSARGGHTMLTYEFHLNGKHRAVLFGGKGTGGVYKNDIWELWIDDATGDLSWEEAPRTGGPLGRAFHTAVFDDGWKRIVISGGETAANTVSDSTFGLEGFSKVPLGGWSTLAPNTGNGKIGHQTIPGPLVYNQIPEIFTPSSGTGSWSQLDEAVKYMGWYPFTFALPSGNVFYAGPAGDSTTFVLDLSVSPPRWKDQTFPSLHAGGAAVMYEPGSVLKSGGPDNIPSKKSERIRLQANDEALDDPPWQFTAEMETVRVNHNLTVLPNGKVLATGGTTQKNVAVFLRHPELWDPATGNWSGGAGPDSLAISSIVRGYHSSAILLPDGRVMTAGGDHTPNANSSLLYCPPYLFTTGDAAASRPTIDSAVVQVNYSQDFVIKTGANQTIAQVVLIRPGAATHGFDQSQFRVPLTFTPLTGVPRLVVKGPANACIAPPGNYLLFIVKSNPDTPSIAQWVTVGTTTSDTTRPRPVDNMYADIVGQNQVWLAWTAPGDDANGGTPCSYDFRQQWAPITSDAIFAGGERPVPQPLPQLGGTLQSQAVTGLFPCTDYYFSVKARDDWVNWSLLGNSAEATTVCGGGGGFARAPAGAPIASLRTAPPASGASRARSPRSGAGWAAPRPDAEPAGLDPGGVALAAEMRRVGGAPEWTVYRLEAAEAAALAAEDATAGIVMQSRDAGGAWVTAERRYPIGGGQVFGLRGFRDPGRAVFLGDYTVQQAFGTVGAGAAAGQAFEVVSARHSRLGNLTTAMDSSGSCDSSLEAGDTLRLAYGATSEPSRAAEDWFLLVAPAGSAGAAGRRGSGEEARLPSAFALYANQPNPFRGTTVIPFDLPVPVSVRIDVYDVLGRRVATLADASFPAGFHSVEWDLRETSGARARPGIYLYRMTAGAFRAKGKMSVIE